MAADSAHEPPERDDLLHVDDVLEVLVGAVQRHLLDRLGRLAGVLGRIKLLKGTCSANTRFAGSGRPRNPPYSHDRRGLRSGSRLNSSKKPSGP